MLLVLPLPAECWIRSSVPCLPLARRQDQLAHRIQLVEAGKDHCLLADDALTTLAVVPFLLFLFDEQEVAEDVDKAVPCQNVLPQVTGAIAGGVLGIARAAPDGSRMTAPVERQEESLGPGNMGSHVDFIGIGGKVDQCPLFEIEQRRAGVAILFVLLDGVAPVLAGARILQLTGGHRQQIDR